MSKLYPNTVSYTEVEGDGNRKPNIWKKIITIINGDCM